jgi:hypothetical protein
MKIVINRPNSLFKFKKNLTLTLGYKIHIQIKFKQGKSYLISKMNKKL